MHGNRHQVESNPKSVSDHFRDFFFVTGAPQPTGDWDMHNWQVQEYNSREAQHPLAWALGGGRSEAQDFVLRSALGVAKVYNHLPRDIVMSSPSVDIFQAKLQKMVGAAVIRGINDWRSLLSPRSKLTPLRQLLSASSAST